MRYLGGYSWRVMFAIAVLCSGCATDSGQVARSFVPNEREGMVYGRMDFVVDGQTLAPDAHMGFLKASIRTLLSKFGGVDTLSSNEWKAGEFIIDANAKERGEFAAKLPVGRYYIFEIMYFAAVAYGDGMTGWRTYAETSGSRINKPFIITFDVLPNKVTYLGTIRHLIQTDGLQQRLYFDLQFADEYTNSTKIFLERFPALSNAIETRAYKIETLTAPIKNKK
jgi:hypothetical protein